jgi:hypothetical protein
VSWSWGSRGHGLICEAAIHLVRTPELKSYLIEKTQGITYLCNIPDIHWKNIKGTENGSTTHFFEVDHIGLSFKDIPTQFSEVEKMALGKIDQNKNKPILSVARELGSIWWRADQFSRLAVEAGKKASLSGIPNKDDEDVYIMWAMMGLLGHFVGDNAQPLHTSSDYDGWQKGHGGIHGYYEYALVNELTYDTLSEIIKASKKAEKELSLPNTKTVIENMRTLSELSHKDLEVLLKLDPIIKKSEIREERGMELKTAAERRPAAEAFKKFKPLLLSHMARAATLLAHSWDQIYIQSGKPPVHKDNSYKFPHEYPFVAPDYIGAK